MPLGSGRIGKLVRIQHRTRCGDLGREPGSPKTGLATAHGRNSAVALEQGRVSGSP